MAVTVDTLSHDALDSTKLVGTESSSAGVLPKDIADLLDDSEQVISISSVYVEPTGKIYTTIVRETD
tara:strand:- start:1730 stop:1930 length:201 start_codon:yes stop_codon:yes gene_type:complete